VRRGRLPPAASRPTPRTAPCQCSPFDSRQGAGAFNQPLNWDTSKVTSMRFMFDVRSSPCPDPCVQSDPPLHAACAAVARRLPHLPRTAPRMRLSMRPPPPFDSRQHAYAFNQPLSWDLSSLTEIGYMFFVRSSPCPLTHIALGPCPARCIHRGCFPPLPHLAPRPHLAPHRILSFRLSAVHRLLVRRQQAVDSLRMGGLLGLRLHPIQ